MNRWLLPLLVSTLLFIVAFRMFPRPSTHAIARVTPQPKAASVPEAPTLSHRPLTAQVLLTTPSTNGLPSQQTAPVFVPTPTACYPTKPEQSDVAQPDATDNTDNTGNSAPVTPVAFAQAVADLINRQRQEVGIAPLTLMPTLTLAAYRHSIDMTTQSIPRHEGSDGSSGGGRMLSAGYTWQTWAEIIGWGFTDPSSMVEWWLNDAEHRAVLLSPAFTEFGVGYAALSNTPWRTYWTVNFGRPVVSGTGPAAVIDQSPALTAIAEEEGKEEGQEEGKDQLPLPAPAVGQVSACPVLSQRPYTLIPMEGSDRSHPAPYHADLNLARRGYRAVTAPAQLLDLSGPVDADAPQLGTLFANHQPMAFIALYQIYDWDWGCGEHGCQGRPLTAPTVTLLGIQTRPGALLQAPARRASIYGDDYVATVLYAEPTRITLAYTRDGSVANGYTVHLEQVCVDPNLVQRYTEADHEGRQQLPALAHGQIFGIAMAAEVRIAIRDRGAFLDPRSRKDWWHGF